MDEIKLSKKQKEIAELLLANKWWPFTRVDGKLLQKLNKLNRRNEHEEAPF